MQSTKLVLALFSVTLLFNSCAYKTTSYHSVAKNINSKIFIEMPKNILVFENISNIIYTAVWKRFKQLGYNLTSSSKNALTLKIKIKNLLNLHKMISEDVIVYSQQIRLDLDCDILDKNKKPIANKTFTFPFLFYKSKRTIMDHGYFKYSLKEIMEKTAAPRIERYFRKYWP